MRNLFAAALTALVLSIGLFGCGDDHGWTEVDENDPRLVAAREEARRTFPDFLKALKSRKPGDACSVEVFYQGVEYIQIQVLKASESELVGVVESYPTQVSLKKGATVTVSLADMSVLSDWAIYTEDGEVKGGFVSAEQAKLERGSSGG
ncbi:MAG: DUF2314 domain-containing protein [Phycisphaerales bacterium]|nr:DUF2314 domain-containing protein [Phycisphaerales bacterium]